jgi:hypothetical protein
MRALRNEAGSALITVIVAVATMFVLGTATIAIVLTQTDQTAKANTTEAAYNLAEAALNAQAFLLARDWPRTVNAATCSSQTFNGDLTMPVASVTVHDQVQRILAQTYTGDKNAATSHWWLTACAEGGRDSWSSTLLSGPGYDNSPASTGPRRMWVRAEATVAGRRRAVVALVQAGQAPVFPPNLAVVTGRMGADLGTFINGVTNGALLGPLTNLLIGNNPMFVGNVGLRCALLDAANLLQCTSALLKATAATTLGPLLQANNYIDFRSDTAITTDKVALLRQQAQASGTYRGTISAGTACLPAGSAGKIVFIEQVGDGTGQCQVNTVGGATAAALIVASGGVQVQGGGTFTGVIYAMHRAAVVPSTQADVRIENGSKVVGAVFIDDNPALAAASRHGWIEVVPPPINMSAVINALPVCQIFLVGPILCATVTGLLGGTLDALLNALGATGVTQLVASLTGILDASLPAITFDGPTVNAVTTMNDSSIVPGTFRQVGPMY